MNKLKCIDWNNLEDAYGAAIKIPILLNKVIASADKNDETQSELWFELWSRLYHQDTIFSASYAAVPILVNSIPRTNIPININFFLLPIAVEIIRKKALAPEIPDALKKDYFQALKILEELADIYMVQNHDKLFDKVMQAIKLVFSGNISLAEDLLE